MVDFADFIAVINGEIAEVDMTLKRSRDERDGRPVIALVSSFLPCFACSICSKLKEINCLGEY